MSGICDHDPIPSQIDLEELIAAKQPHYADAKAPAGFSRNPELQSWLDETMPKIVDAAHKTSCMQQAYYPDNDRENATHDAYAYPNGRKINWGVNGPTFLCSGHWMWGEK